MNELVRKLLFLPRQGSTIAASVDTLHFVVITITMLGATLVFAVALYFLVRYHGGKKPYAPTPLGAVPMWLEAGLAVGTLLLFIVLWQIGFAQYVRIRVAPADAMNVYVTAKQWMWRFAYPDGRGSVAAVYVPVGRPVKLIMTSRDVIHSFYVPDFRIKQDVIPGQYSSAWFEAKQTGVYEILCAEYCGAGHSTMRGTVVVLSAEGYAKWLAGAAPLAEAPRPEPPNDPFVVTEAAQPGQLTSMVREGERAAAELGCLRCHSVDGAPHIGPTWVGLYGARRQFNDGTNLVADEAYLTESMMDPARHIVAGYLPFMPSYQGILQPAQAAAIVELIRTLAITGPAGPTVTPAAPLPGVPFVNPGAPNGQ